MPIHHQRTHPRDIRRLHKKSRLGCQTCKRRKVKCDETKPTCNKCASFGVPCDYSPSATINCREASTSAPDKPRRGRPRSNWALWAEQIRLSSTGEPAPPASNGLNVDDFELFHKYMTKTLDTVDDERKLFRDGIPRLSFQSPGILSLILAFSAYHLAKTRSFEAERYVSMAERHMALALRSATALLQNMSRENGSALYVTAVLVCFTAFAKGPLPGDLLLVAGEGQVAWLSLLRGVRLVVSTTGWSCIFNGVLAPYAPQPESSTTTRTVSPESDLSPGQLEDWQLSLNEVSDLIDICGDKELKATYRSDFEMLNKSFTLTFGTGCHARRDVEGRMEVILAWVYQIDDPFVRGMNQEDPVALIILGHFCVLLFTLRRYWFLEGWATHILEEILRRSPASRKWLHWPLQYVQGQEEGQ